VLQRFPLSPPALDSCFPLSGLGPPANLYGITSEPKLVEELRMHLAWRWFTGLGFDQDIPNHSTFSKNFVPVIPLAVARRTIHFRQLRLFSSVYLDLTVGIGSVSSRSATDEVTESSKMREGLRLRLEAFFVARRSD
jgi:hypothetical protein